MIPSGELEQPSFFLASETVSYETSRTSSEVQRRPDLGEMVVVVLGDKEEVIHEPHRLPQARMEKRMANS